MEIPRLWLWACLLVAWLTSLYFHQLRWQQEASHRSTEVLLDFTSLVEFGRSRGLDWSEVLPEFRKAGITALAFSELRLDELEQVGICKVYSGVDLGGNLRLGSGQPPLPNPQSTYLVQWDEGIHPWLNFSQLQEAVSLAFGAERVRPWTSPSPEFRGSRILEISLPLRAVQSVGICFPHWAISEVGDLRVWLRPENKAPVTAEGVKAYLGRLQEQYPVEGVIFGGSSNEVLGYPDELDETVALLEQFGWKFGLIELPRAVQQKGIETLVRSLPQQTVRVFTVPPAQQANLKPPRVAQMYGLAARERNARVLYLRPYAYDPTPDRGFEQPNERLFELLLADLGKRVGPADVFLVTVAVPPWGLALLAVGSIAAFWLALEPLWSGPGLWKLASLGLGAAIAAALPFTPLAHLGQALLALATSCCFGALAVTSQFAGLRQASQGRGFAAVMLASSRCFLVMSLISLVGACVASCFLQATTYKLGLDVFRGVKVLTVLMPALLALGWMLSAEERRYWLQLGLAPLRLYQLLALAALAVGAVIYTMRTGNAGAELAGEALEVERWVRMVLDQTLGVRPRFKEFLLAHPAMVIFPLLVRWGWREAAAVALALGAIGQVGLLDTFAHVHTPLQVSLIRCLLGLVLGGLIGWLWGGLLWQLERGLDWVRKRLGIST